MGCPHSTIGSPEWCSQCRSARARVVMRDDATGTLTIDGKFVDRKFMLPAPGLRTVRRGARKRTISDVSDPDPGDD